MRNVRIGAVSFLVDDTPHTIEANVERACGYIREAGQRACDLVVLPEMFRTVNLASGEIDAEAVPGAASEAIARAAHEAGTNVIAPYYVLDAGTIYNQATVFNRAGAVVGWYRKVQPTGAEAGCIAAGSELPVFTLDFGRVAVMICLDLYFPEIARIYAHKGAEILCWPTVTHGPAPDALTAQLRSRAIDNALVVVEANMACAAPYAPYIGRSRPGMARIVDTAGDTLAATGRRHGLAVADVDLDEIRLTSYTVLLREPDHFREDMESITRLDLYAREYAALAAVHRRASGYAPAGSLSPPADEG